MDKRNMSGLSLCAIVAFVLITGTSNGLRITYECKPLSHQIVINVDSLNGSITYKVAVEESTMNPNNINCSIKLRPLEKKDKSIPMSGCITPGNWTLYLMEPRGTLENTIGVGQFYTYNIACPIQTNLSSNVIVDSTLTPTAMEPTIELKMKITPNQIHLGQEVQVQITEQGTVHHNLSLVSCDATSTDGKETIWLVAANGTKQPDLVKNVTTGIGSVIMTLYGFRFTQDSNVNITCTVKICGAGSSCKDAGVSGRDVEASGFTVADQQTVSGSFSVMAISSDADQMRR